MSHLPLLIVAVPLFGAPLCVLLRHAYLAWLLTLGISIFCFYGATELVSNSMHGSVPDYRLGGWPAPWGIVYQITPVNALITLLVSLIFTIVSLYSRHSIAHEIGAGRKDIFYCLMLLLLSGLLGITVTNDLFNIFVFLEISALASYALVAMNKGGLAALAAFRYLIIGSVGATLFLLGIGYIYTLTGTLNLDDITQRLATMDANRTSFAAFALIGISLMLKTALFPLHQWLPNAYTHSLSTVSALLAGTSTKVVLYLLIMLTLRVFGTNLTAAAPFFDTLLLTLAGSAILVGGFLAIRQLHAKRLLAYSSIAQIGFLTLGVSLMSTSGLTASLIHLFNHSIIKVGLFLALGCLIYRVGSGNMDKLEGLARKMPWTGAAIVLGGLSLIGIPLTSGFISKWYLVLALLETSQWFLIAVVLLGSLLTVVYVWRLLETIYRPYPHPDSITEAPLVLLIPTWVLVGLNLYLGIQPQGLVEIARTGAHLFLGDGS